MKRQTNDLVATSHAYYKALGARITQLRKQHGMTQAELARAIGVSQQTVFAYELGDRRVTLPSLPKLAKALAVSVEELIGVTAPLRTRTPRRSPKILRHAERIQRLSKTQQRFVIRIIDVLLERPSNGTDGQSHSTPIPRNDAAAMPHQGLRCGPHSSPRSTIPH